MQHFDSSLLSNAFVPRSSFYDSPFGRIFGHLDPWVPEGKNDDERRANISHFATEAMFEPDNAGTGYDNPAIPAGYTYLGQFVDHDITFDPTSSLMRRNDPNRIRNFRTPRFDLDSVYAAGPKASPYLYRRDRFGFFIIESGQSGKEEDLPRNGQGTALIGDPRNDENVLVSQIQLSFLKLHNRVLDRIVGSATKGATDEQFREAQRLVRWFYQYIVWHDFVKRLVANKIYDSVLVKAYGIYSLNTYFYKWKHAPYIPVEFSVAAYRFGHSLVRPSYKLNLSLGADEERPIFAPPPGGPGLDLRGGKRLHEAFSLQWDWFLQFPSSHHGFPQPTRKISTMLSKAVFSIPDGLGGSNPLATLNLWRGWQMELPSGTAVAKAMGVEPHKASGMEDSLFYYILKEAETLPGSNAGKMLGPVGGRIVAEVFAGLLSGDPTSFVNIDPNWRPDSEPHLGVGAPINGGDDWEFADLIKAAGMPVDNGEIRNILA